MSAAAVVRHVHTEGQIPDFHEMVWLGVVVQRDKRGRLHKHGYTRWAKVVCNNPGCKAEVLVNPEVVAAIFEPNA